MSIDYLDTNVPIPWTLGPRDFDTLVGTWTDGTTVARAVQRATIRDMRTLVRTQMAKKKETEEQSKTDVRETRPQPRLTLVRSAPYNPPTGPELLQQLEESIKESDKNFSGAASRIANLVDTRIHRLLAVLRRGA